MHFTTLYIMKDKKAEELSTCQIKEEFREKYCYCCGETTPENKEWCDWFKIGGRWNDVKVIIAKNGYKWGENGIGDGYGKPQITVANIEDVEDIDTSCVYAVADENDVYEEKTEEFYNLIQQIKEHKISGVVCLLDCHD